MRLAEVKRSRRYETGFDWETDDWMKKNCLLEKDFCPAGRGCREQFRRGTEDPISLFVLFHPLRNPVSTSGDLTFSPDIWDIPIQL